MLPSQGVTKYHGGQQTMHEEMEMKFADRLVHLESTELGITPKNVRKYPEHHKIKQNQQTKRRQEKIGFTDLRKETIF